MTWTTDLPTVSGYYWFCNECDEKEIVHVDVAKKCVQFFDGIRCGLTTHVSRAKPLWQHIPTPPDE